MQMYISTLSIQVISENIMATMLYLPNTLAINFTFYILNDSHVKIHNPSFVRPKLVK